MTVSTTDAKVRRSHVGHTSLLYALKRVELAVRAHLDELLRPYGITALQYTALTVLERHDGLAAAQLARDSFVTAQSIADMVRALEKRGLIQRERNAKNRRELLIHLSENGRQLLDDVAGAVAALESQMVAALSDGEIQEFRSALGHAWRALA